LTADAKKGVHDDVAVSVRPLTWLIHPGRDNPPYTEMPKGDHGSNLRVPDNSTHGSQVKGWKNRLSTMLSSRSSSETHSLAPEETAEDTTEISQKGEHVWFLLASGQRSQTILTWL
jgi:hypothetical protein